MTNMSLAAPLPQADHQRRVNILHHFMPRSVSTKLFAIAIVAIVAMLIFGAVQVAAQVSQTRSLELVVIYNEEAQRVETLLRNIRRIANDLTLILDENQTHLIPTVLADNERLLADFSTYRSRSETYNLTADITFTRENEPLFNNVRADVFRAVTFYRDGDFDSARVLQERIDRNTTHLETGLERAASSRSFELSEQLEQAKNLQNLALTVTSVIFVAATIILTATSYAISQPIINNLNLLGQTARKYEQGDYAERVQVNTQDELNQLALSFNSMAEGIQVREVQLKEARKEALAAQRIANENSRLKSEFLSTMSHELRTPMNAIEGFAGIMLKGMAGVEYNDKAERYLNKIQSNSRRLLGLINDFLDLSRIEAGRFELAHMPMSPVEMGQKWRDNLGVLADNKVLDFEVTVDPHLPETIYGDEESLTKIAINLVGNAIKFTEKGSVKLTLNKRADQLEMQVSDTGIGIPPHARDFIFDEFRQVDQSSKRVHGGTGLGLAIVQKLARIMGGTVTVQSEVGVGSTFTVLVPIHIEGQVVYGEG